MENHMSEGSDRFRMRAQQCRELSKVARDEQSRRTLAQMADELEQEAAKIDAEALKRSD